MRPCCFSLTSSTHRVTSETLGVRVRLHFSHMLKKKFQIQDTSERCQGYMQVKVGWNDQLMNS